MWIVLPVLALVLAAQLWVRLAPLPQTRLQGMPGPDAPGVHQLAGGGKWVLPLADLPDDVQAQLDQIAISTPRTRKLAEGTYVTRSALWGFPDVTRVWTTPDALHIHAHLVVGKSDMGVNAKRVESWLAALTR
ncbi:DUF1499 domain-containing protein [Aliiroseovarius marinus]|uniref:DUF1499 domain-containing protein n=1 Tax=Aliiroseovarius marinus TaxID=2500159 RepID=UPI003D7C4A18